MGVSAKEIILPYPAPFDSLEPVTEIRSTLIASSLQSLKARGHFDRYSRLLAAEHRDTILHCIAGQWFPIAVGLAHYSACDRLGLSVAEQLDIGSDVSRRVHETFLGVLVKMAKGVGVSPWLVLGKGNQLFSRLARGGGIQITKVGPKDVEIEIARLPLLEVTYFRNACQALYQVAIGMFAEQRAHVRLLAPQSKMPGTLTTLAVSWV